MAEPRRPMMTSISLEGFLSFGYGQAGLVGMPMKDLNVIIGPNGSGKSNFIEALALLRAVPRDLPTPIRRGGGIKDWIFAGGGGDGSGFSDGSGAGVPAARLEVVLGEGHGARTAVRVPAIRYRLVFGAAGDRFVVLDERLERADAAPDEATESLYFGHEHGRLVIQADGGRREIHLDDLDQTQSIVSQRKDPDTYPELTRLGAALDRIRIYRSWQFGPDAGVRTACSPDVRTDYLTEELDNLPARLAVLKGSPPTKRRLIELVRELAPSFSDFEVVPEGGTLHLYLTEGDRSIPARRLSDGTLRYLCLLAILVDPSPSPLICIEEPELGLHPDILPLLATLLIEASARTQLVVTTHSDVLVDALSDHPDAVLVCEKQADVTKLWRLDIVRLQPWLERYRLGDLWTRGELGGTRW